LENFKLDMNLQTVVLTFSETMKASTLLGPQLTFYSTPATQGATPTVYPLTGGTVSTVNSHMLTLTMSPTDFNALQLLESLATSKEDTYLALTAVAQDMNTQTLTEILPAVAKQAATFAEDEKAATLVDFDLDLTAEVLTLVFSETMDVSSASFDAKQILLQAGDAAGANVAEHQLTGELAQPSRADSTQIVVKLTKDDLEAIKVQTGLATGGEADGDNTWISITNELVSDQSGVAVTLIADSAAKRVRTFKGDETAPILEDFTLDMANGKVVLSFTESMAGKDVKMASMSIQNVAGNSPSASVPLGAGTYASKDALTVEFTLSDSELNAIKKATNLGTEQSNTFIKLNSGAVKDMAGQPVALTVNGASTVGPDTVRPTVASFTMTMVTGSEAITVVFDETVKVSSLAFAEISLQNVKTGGDSVSLDNAESESADGTSVVIKLTKGEVDELKRLDICV
jgi:hypothetical protein